MRGIKIKTMILNSIVLKVASRCNLNCSYCYIYNKGDLSYKTQPKTFNTKLIPILFNRIKEYMYNKNIDNFTIVFHGGEPMLIGISFYKKFIQHYQEIFEGSNKRIGFGMQTNGTLLDEKNVSILNKLGIQIGVSMDTTKSSNEKYRVYHNGKSSYNEIVNGFNFAKKQDKQTGILSVIDVNKSPLDTYKHIKNISPNRMNLLFPDETHDTILNNDIRGILGSWLCNLFDLWYFDKSEKPSITLFTQMIGVILNLTRGSDAFGKSYGKTMIIETNGDIQTNDTLRVCKNQITHSNFNIKQDELNVIEEIPLAKLYYYAHHKLSHNCKKCTLEKICSGGYLINRYSKKNKFDNESIYCKDIAQFICHVQNILADDEDVKKELNLDKLNYENIIEEINYNKINKESNEYLQSF